ncbi:OmpA family protein [Pedobacter sp. SYSU D00535]|uniref:OmpA family protein n=1 Tax=Pedobacter sp. SYSU D00535 TaxID=2810308 RepID=UPI001A95D53B|nr:OmpA family protein [Pedobacter sp. SYSU D00535]
MRKIFLILFVLLTASAELFPQAQSSKSAVFKKAAKEYNAMRYVAAVPLLRKVVKAEPQNKEAKEMLANSYRNLKNYDQALYWYERLSQESGLKPQLLLNYAEALLTKEQYEKAEQWYRKYQQSTYNKSAANNFVKAFPSLGQLKKNTNGYTVSYLNINTAAAEYAPTFYKGGLIFSSNRETKGIKRKVFAWDGTPYSNLFTVSDIKSLKGINPDSVLQDVKKRPEAYKKQLYKFNDDDTEATSNDSRTLGHFAAMVVKDTLGKVLAEQVKVEMLPSKVNSEYHEAAAVYSNGSLFFTRNNYYKRKAGSSKEGINKLKIFTASGENFDEVLPFEFNSDEYSVGHPAISKDGKILIFASDMPAGYGGSDLYYCTRQSVDNSWSKPINMGGIINTEGNELFPFIDNKGGLIFSSTGHFGLGGLDLFYINLDGIKPKGVPVNFGSPVNSSVDDFAAIINEDGRTGYFSSNRRGNDDIYSFSSNPFSITLKGKVSDSKTGKAIANSRVILSGFNLKDSVSTDGNGQFSITLDKEVDYQADVKKEGYLSAQSKLTTKGIRKDSVIRVSYNLDLVPPVRKQVIVNCDSIRKAFEVHNIYYDVDKSLIRPDAVPALDHVVRLLKENPGISVVAASHCDSRANEEYNIKLSLRRSNAVRDYLIAHGIEAKRIKAEYYGKSRLAVEGDESAEDIQRLNRRTEFFVIANGVNVTLQGCLK